MLTLRHSDYVTCRTKYGNLLVKEGVIIESSDESVVYIGNKVHLVCRSWTNTILLFLLALLWSFQFLLGNKRRKAVTIAVVRVKVVCSQL